MPTQNVNITEHQAEFIRACVESGEYNNASELVREALRLLKAQKDEYDTKLELLRAAIKEGQDAIDEGRYISLDSKEKRAAFFAEIKRRGRERLAERADAPKSAAQ